MKKRKRRVVSMCEVCGPQAVSVEVNKKNVENYEKEVNKKECKQNNIKLTIKYERK